jgi:predicted GNAT family acetyltransferase
MTIPVIHNEAERRFEAQIDGQTSVALYRRSGRRVSFVHTEVPYRQRGRGVAAALAETALAWARSEGLTVMPACSYFASYMQRHRETQDLLEAD